MDEMENGENQNMTDEEPFEFDDLIGDAPVLKEKKAKVSGDNENEISPKMDIDQPVPEKARSTTPQSDTVNQERGTDENNIPRISPRPRITRSSTRKLDIIDPERRSEEKDNESLPPEPRTTRSTTRKPEIDPERKSGGKDNESFPPEPRTTRSNTRKPDIVDPERKSEGKENESLHPGPRTTRSTIRNQDIVDPVRKSEEKENERYSPGPRTRKNKTASSLRKIVKPVQKKKDKQDDSTEDDDWNFETKKETNEEYSDAYYEFLMEQNLSDNMKEYQARIVEKVHRKMNRKKLTLDNRMKKVVLGGRFDISTWYDGAYPEDIAKCHRVFLCDGCFMHFTNQSTWERHALKCDLIRCPPGDEVYRDMESSAGIISVFRVDADKQYNYCKQLSLFGMLFISDKCVFIDIYQFDYFVVTLFMENEGGFRPVGYFSRQRLSEMKHNLCCFCVFPCYQKKGIGRFIIDFSYQLSIISKMPGGPERPLSPFGRVSYTSYWKRSVVLAIQKAEGEINMEDLMWKLGMRKEDIIEVIENLFSVKMDNDELAIDENLLNAIAESEEKKDEDKLYAKLDCFEEQFVEYMKRYKLEMELLEKSLSNEEEKKDE